MRRLTRRHLLLLAALAPAACKKPERVRLTDHERSQLGLRSVLHVADPEVTQQLVRGFHPVEQNSWRWTMGHFSVTLARPAGAERNGAWLMLKFSIPDVVIEKLKSVAVSANVQGHAVSRESYTSSGEYTYRKEVPAAAFQNEEVSVEFALDHYLASGMVEQRELGVIATMIGLEAR